jgi:ATP-dependent Lon protease
MNDFKYFKNMDIDAQKNIILQLKKVNAYSNVDKPYRLQLLDSDMPIVYKSAALKKINVLNFMDPASGEYYKIKQWVDTFMSIPFGKTQNLPLSIEDGIDKCSAFMENAKKQLDECVYGLDDAKMQILQLVGQWLSNPNSIGTAIAIKGPPGTGKTTLIKEGISKILQRPFAFLALGGATDSSFLEGHSYTYEGSSWGKIVDILIQSKCMNPVIYFDELDKISDTPKGEEITGILTHLTDTTQNGSFHDKYFSNMDFDLSKALFIFSYNDESKVNPILKDRMYRIHTDGYDTKKKLVIAKDYLIPKIEKNVNFKKGEITIEDEALTKIIDAYTDGEKGVRNLKRCLEIIYTKLNLYRLMKKDSTLFENEKTIRVEFPFNVTSEITEKLIKKGEKNTIPEGMYI